MSKPIHDLSSLISAGRAGKGIPANRSEVLAALLRKRAAAWRSGLSELESRLRNQILWSLPVESPADEEPAAAGADRADPDRDAA